MTAGMAATRPSAVARSASAMPGATTARFCGVCLRDADEAVHDAPDRPEQADEGACRWAPVRQSDGSVYWLDCRRGGSTTPLLETSLHVSNIAIPALPPRVSLAPQPTRRGGSDRQLFAGQPNRGLYFHRLPSGWAPRPHPQEV
jgi:hypothetical protein